MDIQDLKIHHEKNKFLIRQRLDEFRKIKKGKDKNEYFKELCFCLLTAGTSAELGIKTINHLGGVIHYGNEADILERLKEVYRFYNVRARYIFLARDKFKQVDFTKEGNELRDEIVEKILGIGYKEASHFLRNIGYKDYGILDKHIINCLYELKVIDEAIPPKNRRDYLEIEEKMRRF